MRNSIRHGLIPVAGFVALSLAALSVMGSIRSPAQQSPSDEDKTAIAAELLRVALVSDSDKSWASNNGSSPIVDGARFVCLLYSPGTPQFEAPNTEGVEFRWLSATQVDELRQAGVKYVSFHWYEPRADGGVNVALVVTFDHQGVIEPRTVTKYFFNKTNGVWQGHIDDSNLPHSPKSRTQPN